MRIGRCLPPTATPLGLADCLAGLAGLLVAAPALRKFEGELKAVLCCRNLFLVSSGKAALTLVLRALGRLSPDRREVIIPAYTCYSVPAAVIRAGLVVVPVDIDPATLDFNPDALARALGPTTLCVVPVHLFGRPAAVERVAALCDGKGIFLVEDAAQALGGAHRGKMLGTRGDVGIYSLGRGKNITCGGGGVIVTDSERIAASVREEFETLPSPSRLGEALLLAMVAVMAVCIRPACYWLPAALPFLGLGETTFTLRFPIARFSGMRAGLLRRWQVNLARGNAARRANAARYLSRLAGAPSDREDIPFLRYPLLLDGEKERERILELSRKHGLGISAMYPAAVDELPRVRSSRVIEECAQARQVARRLITLPTHYLVTAGDVERIVRSL